MNKDQSRLYVAVALSAAVLFVWQKWFMPKPQRPVAADGGVAQVGSASPDGGAPLAAAVPPGPNAAQPVNPGAPRPEEQLAEFDGPTRHLTFSSYGGALKSAVLKGEQFKRKVDGKDVQVDLVTVAPGQPLPFALTLGQGMPLLAADQPYQMEKTDDGVTFTAQVGGLTIVKRYTVPRDGYDVALDLELRNASGGTVQGPVTVNVTGFIVPGSEKSGSFFNRGPSEARQPIARIDGSTERQGKDKDGQPLVKKGNVAFAGLDEHYFLAVVYPVQDKAGQVLLSAPEDGHRHADFSFDTSVAPSGSAHRTLGLYLGPKLKERLEEAGSSIPALRSAKPELTQSVDYGFVAVISTALLTVLRLFHSLIHNWGVAILLLTLAVKLVTLPLTMKQMGQAEHMRKLQPQLEAIKAKYKDDRERQNLETMKLYQQSGVNPMAGCLPLLIQMPVFWGLYRTLEYAFDIYRQPFIHGWINDLSAQDPSYVLPVALIVTMFVSQKMMPATSMDPTQQKMMTYMMPVMFGVFMFGLPAGLSLYYAFNNVLNIFQQLWLRKRYPAARPPNDPKKKTSLATA